MRFRSYSSLHTFVVVARHLHMGGAADELNLSKGAVSYQIRQLEEQLGFRIFSRANRNLALTAKGADLLQVARISLEQIDREILRLGDRGGDRITIGMATYFASRWLSPRLMRFIAAHPRIGLRLQPLVNLTDLRSNELDLAIRWGKGDWQAPELKVELIFRSPVMLTASSRTGEKIAAEGIRSVLQRQTLLHDRDSTRAWRDWFAAAGIAWSPGSDDLVIPDPNVRVQAVIDGQGIALNDRLVEDEVNAGRLYQYAPVTLNDYGYYLAYPKAVGHDSPIRIFRDWILDEAAR